jgi:hypothetical protein
MGGIFNFTYFHKFFLMLGQLEGRCNPVRLFCFWEVYSQDFMTIDVRRMYKRRCC